MTLSNNNYDFIFKVVLLIFLGIIAVSTVYIALSLVQIPEKIFELTNAINLLIEFSSE